MSHKRFATCFLLLLLLHSVSCSKDDPLFCDDENPCGQVDGKSFCDTEGKFEASGGVANTCIAIPALGCNPLEPCNDPAFPFCDEQSGQCYQCNSTEDCEQGYCLDRICSACQTDNDCQEASEQNHCDANGQCVECVESSHCDTQEGFPVCDQNVGSCVECLVDSDCESLFCETDKMQCKDQNEIIYVKNDGDAMSGCGSKDRPCDSVSSALLVKTDARNLVRLLSSIRDSAEITQGEVTVVGEPSYVWEAREGFAIAVSKGAAIAIKDLEIDGRRQDAGIMCQGRSTDVGQLSVQNVYIHNTFQAALDSQNCEVDVLDSNISNNQSMGISSNSSFLNIVGSTIENNKGLGIDQSGGSLQLFASHLLSNQEGGLESRRGDFTIQNNVFAFNGIFTSFIGGVSLQIGEAARSTFSFNTVVGNRVRPRRSAGIFCDDSLVKLIGNIIWYNQGDIQIDGDCQHGYSGLEQQLSGDNNVYTAPRFIAFNYESIDASKTDFRLHANSPLIDKGPVTGPSKDARMASRPQGEGYDIGAYERVNELDP